MSLPLHVYYFSRRNLVLDTHKHAYAVIAARQKNNSRIKGKNTNHYIPKCSGGMHFLTVLGYNFERKESSNLAQATGE